MIFKLIVLISLSVWILNLIWKTEKKLTNKINDLNKDIKLFSDSVFNEDDNNGKE